MSEMDRLRSRLSGGKPKGAPFEPPHLWEFRLSRCVLAFDPTLSNCGWVIIEVCPAMALAGSGGITVRDRGTIRPSTSLNGFAATWEKARQLNEQLSVVILRCSAKYGCQDIACETPWVGGGGHRTESALIASTLVYLYSGEYFRPVSSQHAYKVLCGGRRPATARAKKDIALSVERYIPESSGRTWNEHQRDAAALALTFLYDDLHGGSDG